MTEPGESAPPEHPRGGGVLVVARPGSGLAVALDGGDAGTGPARIARVAGWPGALPLLRAAAPDAVLLDLELDLPRDAVGQVRRLAPGAALLTFGGAAPLEGADEWLPEAPPPPAFAAVLRAAMDRRRLALALRAARADLEASESRFRNIIQRAADGIVIVGQDGRVRFVNPAAERLFGRPAARLLGEEFGFAVVAGETTEIELVSRERAEPLVAELRASETVWEGSPAQVIALRDVTDRKHAAERAQRLLLERAAREEAERATQRARFLAEASSALDVSLDPEATLEGLARLVVPRMSDWCVVDLLEAGRIRRVARAHGDPAREQLLRRLEREFPPQRDSPHPAARVLRTGRPEVHRGLDREGLRAITVNAAHAELLERLGVRSSMTVPLLARHRLLGAITFVCTERDFDAADLDLAEEVAGRAARALENARLYEASLVANRAKADFLAVISHELRTPLNAVLGYTQILLEGIPGGLDDQQRRYLQSIESSARHLLHLIDELIAYAHLEAGRDTVTPEAGSLAALIREVAEVGEPLVREKGLDFHATVETPDAELYTDHGKVRRIVLNLVSNAAKFTQVGGVTLFARVAADALEITVADTGQGIPPEHLDRIFDDFWVAEEPLRRSTGGTGLGLSVARRLARMLGGTLTAESSPGRGSVFTLRVPRRLPS